MKNILGDCPPNLNLGSIKHLTVLCILDILYCHIHHVIISIPIFHSRLASNILGFYYLHCCQGTQYLVTFPIFIPFLRSFRWCKHPHQHIPHTSASGVYHGLPHGTIRWNVCWPYIIFYLAYPLLIATWPLPPLPAMGILNFVPTLCSVSFLFSKPTAGSLPCY